MDGKTEVCWVRHDLSLLFLRHALGIWKHWHIDRHSDMMHDIYV